MEIVTRIQLSRAQQKALERAVLGGAVVTPDLICYFSQKSEDLRQGAETTKNSEPATKAPKSDISPSAPAAEDNIFTRNSKILILPIDGSLLI